MSSRQIYSLSQLFPGAACQVMQSLIADAAHSMEQSIEVKGRAAIPRLDMVYIFHGSVYTVYLYGTMYEVTACVFASVKLVYLKIATLLFPASDFRHPVTTPAFLYISQALTKVVCHHVSVCASVRI